MPEPNACLVCARHDLAGIDAALVAGEGLNATARRFGLNRRSIQRHAKHRSAKPGDEAPVPAAPVIAESPPPEPASPPPPLDTAGVVYRDRARDRLSCS